MNFSHVLLSTIARVFSFCFFIAESYAYLSYMLKIFSESSFSILCLRKFIFLNVIPVDHSLLGYHFNSGQDVLLTLGGNVIYSIVSVLRRERMEES